MVLLNRIYKHFKGDKYIVLDVVKDATTGENMVLYRALYGEGTAFVRPLDEFCSNVDKHKYPNATQEYRFELQQIDSER